MSERRRTSRFVIPEHTEGTFRLMQDVCVEQMHGDSFVMVSEVPLRMSEDLLIELPRALGLRRIVQVRVVSCTNVWVSDVRRFRVVVRSEGDMERRKQSRDPEALFTPATAALPALGVLVRRIPVRVRDVSTSGCLLESLDQIGGGVVGQLEITGADGERYTESIRVCRSACIAGSPWPWRAGTKFLALTAPEAASVRNIVARFEIVDELSSFHKPLAAIAVRTMGGSSL